MSEEEVVEAEEVEAVADDEEDQLPDIPEGEVAEQQEEEAVAEQQSPWENFRSLPEFEGQDDAAIASRLYEAMQREQAATQALQQYQAVIPAASEYLTHREPFQQWLSERQSQQQPQQAAPQSPEEPSWWNPPQLRDTDRQYLVTDETGKQVISDAAPFDVRNRLTEHQAYKANFASKFLENPESTLGPMVERIVSERAQAIASQQINDLQEESFVRQIEEQNRDWLYDQNGNAAPAGLLVQKYIEDARTMGLQGAKARWDYAYKMVERDLLVQRYMQASQQAEAPVAPEPEPSQPAESPAERNMQYLRQQATRKAPVRAAAGTNARAPSRPMTFAERLAANLQQAGLDE